MALRIVEVCGRLPLGFQKLSEEIGLVYCDDRQDPPTFLEAKCNDVVPDSFGLSSETGNSTSKTLVLLLPKPSRQGGSLRNSHRYLGFASGVDLAQACPRPAMARLWPLASSLDLVEV